MLKTLILTLSVGILLVTLGLATGTIGVPNAWNPWVALSIGDPPNWLTPYKLSQLSDDEEICRVVLAGAEMRFEAVPDQELAPGCGFFNAIRIESIVARVSEPFTLSCRTAVPLAIWERHILQPAAWEHFGQPVVELAHFGSYACRGVYGREDSRLSRHATADALDVAGFTLQDGRSIRVLGAWPGEDEEAEFLRDVHQGACGIFDGVLGPDYNVAHHDHFHFEQAGFRMCR